MPSAVVSRPRTPGAVKDRIRDHYDRLAASRDMWYGRSHYYHEHLERIARSVVPSVSSVLELASGTGNLLAAVEPARGVGLDISPESVRIAQRKHPLLTFVVGDAESFELPGSTFDYVI